MTIRKNLNDRDLTLQKSSVTARTVQRTGFPWGKRIGHELCRGKWSATSPVMICFPLGGKAIVLPAVVLVRVCLLWQECPWGFVSWSSGYWQVWNTRNVGIIPDGTKNVPWTFMTRTEKRSQYYPCHEVFSRRIRKLLMRQNTFLPTQFPLFRLRYTILGSSQRRFLSLYELLSLR